MKSQFILCLTVPGNENHLKVEVEKRFPFLRPSFQKKNFISFKSDREINLEDLKKFDFLFSLRTTLFSEKLPSFTQESKDHFIEVNGELNLVQGDISCENEIVRNIYKLSDKEYWIGWHKHQKNMNGHPFSCPNITQPENSPSRAYLKIAEALVLKNININNTQILELGSAPGGASMRMLELGAKVIGIDPGAMDEIILDNPAFTHILESVQKVNSSDLPEKIDWLVNDMNIPFEQSIEESLRLMKLRARSIQGAFITIKLSNPRILKKCMAYVDKMRRQFKEVDCLQLPSHKKEFLLFVRN